MAKTGHARTGVRRLWTARRAKRGTESAASAGGDASLFSMNATDALAFPPISRPAGKIAQSDIGGSAHSVTGTDGTAFRLGREHPLGCDRQSRWHDVDPGEGHVSTDAQRTRQARARSTCLSFRILGGFDSGLRTVITPLAASVGVTPRVEPTNSRTPSFDSSWAMAFDTAGCPTFIRQAPEENEPVSITLMNVSIAVNLSIRSVPPHGGRKTDQSTR
jgi:hypothetical protein